MAYVDFADTQENRCFGRLKARELTPQEIGCVGGGLTLTGCIVINGTYDENGNPNGGTVSGSDVDHHGGAGPL